MNYQDLLVANVSGYCNSFNIVAIADLFPISLKKEYCF